jgi:hypothetical protein
VRSRDDRTRPALARFLLGGDRMSFRKTLNLCAIIAVTGWLQTAEAGRGEKAAPQTHAAAAGAPAARPGLLRRFGRAFINSFKPSPDFWNGSSGSSRSTGPMMIMGGMSMGQPTLGAAANAIHTARQRDEKKK